MHANIHVSPSDFRCLVRDDSQKRICGWIVEVEAAGTKGYRDRYYAVIPDEHAALSLTRRALRLGDRRRVMALRPLYESDVMQLRLKGGSVQKV